MILLQKWSFFQGFFLGNLVQKNVFYDILERKTPFWAIKTKSLKSRKVDIFSKGLTEGFGTKIAISWNFFLRQYIGQNHFFDDILERKNALLGYKNKKFKNSKNWHFSKGVNPGFCSKNGHFSNFLFLGNLGHKNVFYDIQERKKSLARL